MYLAPLSNKPGHRRSRLWTPWISECAGTGSWSIDTEIAAHGEPSHAESAEAASWQAPIGPDHIENLPSVPAPQSNTKRPGNAAFNAYKYQVGDKIRSRSLPSSLSFQQQNKPFQGVAAPVRILRTPSAPRLVTVRRKPAIELVIGDEQSTVCDGNSRAQKCPETVSSSPVAQIEWTKHGSGQASSRAQFTVPCRTARPFNDMAVDSNSPTVANVHVNASALASTLRKRDSLPMCHANSRPHADFLHNERYQAGLSHRDRRTHGGNSNKHTHIPRPTKAVSGSSTRLLAQRHCSKWKNSSPSVPLAKGNLPPHRVGDQHGDNQTDDSQNDEGNGGSDPGSDETPTKRDYSTKHLSAHSVSGCGPIMRVHRSADRIIMGKSPRPVDVSTTPRRSSRLFKDHGYSPKAAQVLGLDLTPADERQGRTTFGSAAMQETDLGVDAVRGKPASIPSSSRSSANGESEAAATILALERHGWKAVNGNLFNISSQAIHSNNGESSSTSERQEDCCGVHDAFLDEQCILDDHSKAISKHSGGRLHHAGTKVLQKAPGRPSVGFVDRTSTWMSPCKPGSLKQQTRGYTSHAVVKSCVNKSANILGDSYRELDKTYEHYVQGLVAELSTRSSQRSFVIESPQSFPARTSSLQPGTSRLANLTATGRHAENSPLVMRQVADGPYVRGSRLTSCLDPGLQYVTNQAHIETKDVASDESDQLPGLDDQEGRGFASKTSGLVQTYRQDDWNICDKIALSRGHINDSRRKGMLSTVRSMFHKRAHAQHHSGPQRRAESAKNCEHGVSPVKSGKASDGRISGPVQTQHRNDGRHLSTVRGRITGSPFPQISSIPGVYGPPQGPAPPLRRVPLPAAMRSTTAGQVGVVKAQLTSQTSRNRLAQTVGDKVIGINRISALGSPRAANAANARHSAFRELAQATKEFLAEAESEQQYAADEELDRTMKMARDIIRQACNEDMRSPRKQKLIDMGQLIVESCCAARDSLKAVHEAKLASRRAEVAHAHCLTSVSQMAKIIEEWRRAEDSYSV